MNAPLIKLGRAGSFALLLFLPLPIVVIGGGLLACGVPLRTTRLVIWYRPV